MGIRICRLLRWRPSQLRPPHSTFSDEESEGFGEADPPEMAEFRCGHVDQKQNQYPMPREGRDQTDPAPRSMPHKMLNSSPYCRGGPQIRRAILGMQAERLDVKLTLGVVRHRARVSGAR
jgi:hypothetical protein